MLVTTKLNREIPVTKMVENKQQTWVVKPGEGVEIPDRYGNDIIAGNPTVFFEYKRGSSEPEKVKPDVTAKDEAPVKDDSEPPTKEQLEDEALYPIESLKMLATQLAGDGEKPHPNLGRGKLIEFILDKIAEVPGNTTPA